MINITVTVKIIDKHFTCLDDHITLLLKFINISIILQSERRVKRVVKLKFLIPFLNSFSSKNSYILIN